MVHIMFLLDSTNLEYFKLYKTFIIHISKYFINIYSMVNIKKNRKTYPILKSSHFIT